tara:strand:+ start:5185 stop:5376 length:192 start_codon:yes stop_codon:yes gene_type:complete
MAKRSNIENHSEVMSLLGKKLGLMETITHLHNQINKINKELELIEKKKVFTILRGDNNETMDD